MKRNFAYITAFIIAFTALLIFAGCGPKTEYPFDVPSVTDDSTTLPQSTEENTPISTEPVTEPTTSEPDETSTAEPVTEPTPPDTTSQPPVTPPETTSTPEPTESSGDDIHLPIINF